MGLPVHTIEVLNGSSPLWNPDRVKVLMEFAVANGAGGGAGQSVTLNFTGLDLPTRYAVFVDAGADIVAFAAAKTQAGFTLTLNPRLAANTIAAGTVNVLILAW
jgi:hypothetical protein